MPSRLYVKRLLIGLLALSTLSHGARAADWLMLQGAEPDGSADPIRYWGYGQAQFQRDFSAPNGTGQFVPPKVIGPDLNVRSEFNISGAAIGIRGAPMNGLNYAVLFELGNNAATNPHDVVARPLEASMTWHLPQGPRLRMGLFKYPGAEEALQALLLSDYINLSEAVNGLLLERFPNHSYTSNLPPQTLPPAPGFNGFDRSAGTFRDVGAELFDTLAGNSGWQHSYAIMLGNGNGLRFDDPDNNKDLPD
jgi:hypothetical protein